MYKAHLRNSPPVHDNHAVLRIRMVPELLSGSGIIVPDPDAAKKIKEQRNEKIFLILGLWILDLVYSTVGLHYEIENGR